MIVFFSYYPRQEYQLSTTLQVGFFFQTAKAYISTKIIITGFILLHVHISFINEVFSTQYETFTAYLATTVKPV